MQEAGHGSEAKRLRTLGVLGGMSDQATLAYYAGLNRAVNEALGGWSTAEVIISSVDFARIERCVRGDLWDEAGDYLAGKARGLERAGAELLLCVSNTMHRVADAFTAGVGVPFLHIVDPTAEAIRAGGLARVGLLGTRSTMAADFLKWRYRERHGIEVVVPSEEEQLLVDRVIFDELVRGQIETASKQQYLAVVDGLRARGAEGVILGCTEIFMLVGQADRPGFPVFDTTALHIAAAARFALGEPGHVG